MIRVVLPYHLRTLIRSESELQLEIAEPVTIGSVLDAIETGYPVLRGTIRDHGSKKRRPFLRFFVCKEDWSHEPADRVLPDEITSAAEPFMIIGAIAGG